MATGTKQTGAILRTGWAARRKVGAVPVSIALPFLKSLPDDRQECSHRDKTILIIEDDTAFAKALLDYTRKNAYKGLVAVRGDEGLAWPGSTGPGILLDIQLPVKSGWEVMEELKNDPSTRHIPVHIMSSLK